MAKMRRSSMEALEEKIEKAQADVAAAKKNYDDKVALLKSLTDKRDSLRNEELISAVTKSKHSYEEILEFLSNSSSSEK